MLLNLHLAVMFFSLGVIFFADKEAFAWISGRKEVLERKRMRLLHLLMWAGLTALIATGLLLFLPMAIYLLSEPLFVIKLLFVAILVINAILVGRLMHVALTRPYSSLAWQEKLPLLTSGAISTFSWACAILIAFYLF